MGEKMSFAMDREVRLRGKAMDLHSQLRAMVRDIESLADKSACEYQGMLISCIKEVESFLGMEVGND
jgi:hypothetical protein